MIVKEKLYIGGQWVPPSTGATVDVIGAATEEVIGRVPDGARPDMDKAVAAAREAFDKGPWPRMSPDERAAVMDKVSAGIQARYQEIAETISQENGSPNSFSIMGQVFASTMVLDYYAKLARDFPFEEPRQGVLGSILVRREPVGVVAAIVPWNVPLFVTMLKLAPALAAGCTVVLKPAPETPLDATSSPSASRRPACPTVWSTSSWPGVRSASTSSPTPISTRSSFTGSTAAGRRVAGLCGERLRRCTLELGGKSAAIILDDADLAETIAGLYVPTSLMNNGQACVAQTRILASRVRYQEVVDALVEATRTIKVGDPLDPDTAVGPLVAERQRTASRATSPRARRKGRRSPSAVVARPDCPRAGTSSRPCSSMSTTR